MSRIYFSAATWAATGAFNNCNQYSYDCRASPLAIEPCGEISCKVNRSAFKMTDGTSASLCVSTRLQPLQIFRLARYRDAAGAPITTRAPAEVFAAKISRSIKSPIVIPFSHSGGCQYWLGKVILAGETRSTVTWWLTAWWAGMRRLPYSQLDGFVDITRGDNRRASVSALFRIARVKRFLRGRFLLAGFVHYTAHASRAHQFCLPVSQNRLPSLYACCHCR